ncbi:SDR family oxidoreductase [Kribbella sp.]|uniref:SDR family oxidoreductase n=1 Tax=Kribbella sp. TaxID=1871183 RepID=UPI002D3C3693|nr:SDR family oxidoreductase [Kribbella sp.]HZX05010.1 SDR family oxidoreductase [Kribbella sp.]
MFLVIGGRSKIGSALIRLLVDWGEPVRALVRRAEGVTYLPAGVAAVIGDLAEPASLPAAMDGAERVFLLCGPSEQEVQLNINAIDAAERAGARLLVRSSILGADPAAESVFRRDHGAADDYLRASGVPYRIVRPSLFLQNIPETTIPGIDASGTFYANAADSRISMVDTRDVAAVAAKLLTGHGADGTVHDVTGPQALSYDDVAAKLSTALGRPITYTDVPDGAVTQALTGLGLSPWMTDALVGLYQDYKHSGTGGYAAQVTATVQEVTGTPPRTLDALLGESSEQQAAPSATSSRASAREPA